MRTFLAAAFAAAIAAAPLTAPADTLVHSVNYRTVVRQTRPYVSAGEVRESCISTFTRAASFQGHIATNIKAAS